MGVPIKFLYTYGTRGPYSLQLQEFIDTYWSWGVIQNGCRPETNKIKPDVLTAIKMVKSVTLGTSREEKIHRLNTITLIDYVNKHPNINLPPRWNERMTSDAGALHALYFPKPVIIQA